MKYIQWVSIVSGLFLWCALPLHAAAAVRLTEVAWMGVAGDNGQYGEWLELYNDGSDAVNLAGWTLYGDGGGKLLFTLSKTIAAGGYLLVERTTASMPDPVPTVSDEHGTFGGGGLSNSGEDLVLKDATGAVVQSLSYAAGWPAGDASTKETMQWNGSAWITALATPKAPTAVASTESQTDTPTDDAADASGATEAATVVVTSKIKQKLKEYDPHIELTIPRIVDTHVPYRLGATVYTVHDINPSQGMYRWNFGDGTAAVSYRQYQPMTHTYLYPGSYTLWFGYYTSELDSDPASLLATTITVRAPSVAVSVVDSAALRIENTTTTAIDLSGWVVSSGTAGSFQSTLASMTILGPAATITIPASVLRIPLAGEVRLILPDGTPISK